MSKPKLPSRPWLKLCIDCNRGSASVEELGLLVFSYCKPCSDSIDEFNEQFKQWEAAVRRKQRNARKRKKRKARTNGRM